MSRTTRFHDDEYGEGVISTAIAVLIMAFIGAGMWLAFNTVFDNAEQCISDSVAVIGTDGAREDCGS